MATKAERHEMLAILTIARDGMPFISRHYAQFQKLSFPWHWSIAEGTAKNAGSTSWCREIGPGVSTDGTLEYLQGIAGADKRITLVSRPWWEGGKDQMCNTALQAFDKPGILLQVDSDEMWDTETLKQLMEFFRQRQEVGIARFHCRYFVGPDIITVGENCYGANRGEWTRAWRWKPGIAFTRHEPPELRQYLGRLAEKQLTKAYGLTFDHAAYVTESQIRFKQEFYGYAGAVSQWKRLQASTVWPVKLKDYLPWVDDRVQAIRVQDGIR